MKKEKETYGLQGLCRGYIGILILKPTDSLTTMRNEHAGIKMRPVPRGIIMVLIRMP